MPVLDASVAARRYLPDEPDADLARAYMSAAAGTLIAPDFLLAETVGAVRNAVRDGRISPARARFAVADLQTRVSRFDFIGPFVDAALEMALALPHPAGDCIYLAQAVRENDLLVTADWKFLAKVEKSPWGEFAVALPVAARGR